VEGSRPFGRDGTGSTPPDLCLELTAQRALGSDVLLEAALDLDVAIAGTKRCGGVSREVREVLAMAELDRVREGSLTTAVGPRR
jgi:hypothetical protein